MKQRKESANNKNLLVRTFVSFVDISPLIIAETEVHCLNWFISGTFSHLQSYKIRCRQFEGRVHCELVNISCVDPFGCLSIIV